MQAAIHKIELLLESSNLLKDSKVKLSKDNSSKYFKDLRYIYEKQFKTKLNPRDLSRWLNRRDFIYLYFKKDKPVGYIRIHEVIGKEQDKYKIKEIPPFKKLYYLSDLASTQKGYGSKMLKEMFNEFNGSFITSPWHDDLIPYYEKFGFKTYKPRQKNLPSVIQFKK